MQDVPCPLGAQGRVCHLHGNVRAGIGVIGSHVVSAVQAIPSVKAVSINKVFIYVAAFSYEHYKSLVENDLLIWAHFVIANPLLKSSAVDKTKTCVGFGMIEDCYIWGSHRSNGLITSRFSKHGVIHNKQMRRKSYSQPVQVPPSTYGLKLQATTSLLTSSNACDAEIRSLGVNLINL